jgi:hypothetical protein
VEIHKINHVNFLELVKNARVDVFSQMSSTIACLPFCHNLKIYIEKIYSGKEKNTKTMNKPWTLAYP